MMGDEGADVEFAAEDEAGDFVLEGDVGGVAAEEVFFVHADGGEIHGGGFAATGMGEEEDFAGAAHEGNGLMESGLGWNGKDGGIEARGGFFELGGEGGGVGFEGGAGAPLAGEFEAGGHEVGGEDFDAVELEEAGEDEADGALADDEDGVTGLQVEAVDGFEDGVDGFEHGGFLEGVAGGDFDDAREDEGHDADEFGIAAAGWLETGGDAGGFVKGALGEIVMAAIVAMTAGDVVVDGNAVADAELGEAAADLDDDAGGFVAKDAGGRDGAVVDFFDVGGADAADGDAEEEFAGLDFGDGNSFEAEIVGAAIDDGAHGWGDGNEVGGAGGMGGGTHRL